MRQIDDVLREMGESAPPIEIDTAQSWHTGRRRRAWAMIRGGALTVAVVVVGFLAMSGALAPRALVPATPDQSTSTDRLNYPAHIGRQLWVSDLPEDPGPMAALIHVRTDNGPGQWQVVTPDGTRYRAVSEGVPEPIAVALSPDGGTLVTVQIGPDVGGVERTDEVWIRDLVEGGTLVTSINDGYFDSMSPLLVSPQGDRMWVPTVNTQGVHGGEVLQAHPVGGGGDLAVSGRYVARGSAIGWLSDHEVVLLDPDHAPDGSVALMSWDVNLDLDASWSAATTLGVFPSNSDDGNFGAESSFWSVGPQRTLAHVNARSEPSVLTEYTLQGAAVRQSQFQGAAIWDCSMSWLPDGPALSKGLPTPAALAAAFAPQNATALIDTDAAIGVDCVQAATSALAGGPASSLIQRLNGVTWWWREILLILWAAGAIASWRGARRAQNSLFTGPLIGP